MNIFINIIGYLGTALVIISFLLNNLKYLRLTNALGSLLVTIYSLVVAAYPVAILNGFIFVINGYKLLHSYWNQEQSEACDSSDTSA